MSFTKITIAIHQEELDQFTNQELFECLTAADDLYHNDNESFLEDDEYDALRRYMEVIDKTNKYFLGTGSNVRGGKVKLPFEMGSLNQIQIGDIEDWVTKNNLQHNELVLSDKMDGVSGLIIYDDPGDMQISYSRGNGTHGADTFRHMSKIKNVPEKVSGKMVVRVEVELSETAFKSLQDAGIRSRSGKQYKNSRNMTSGLMNSKTNPDIVYEYLSVIAYEIKDFTGNKADQLVKLSQEGFQVVEWTNSHGYKMNDTDLAEFIELRKKKLDYAIDGIVIDVNDAKKRSEMNPTSDTLNPDYSIKYKVTDAENYAETTVVEVEWRLSKHGYWKPRLILEPVELVGVTVTHATGYNAKYILANNIGVGSIVALSRMGDVVPNVVKIISSTTAQMPEGDWEWTVNDKGEQVDAFIADKNVDIVQINQMIDFFDKINAPYLKAGNVTKLFKAGFVKPEQVITMVKSEMSSILGENGNKAYDGLVKKLSDIQLYQLMGAFSNERGIGVRKMKKLQAGLGLEVILAEQFNIHDVIKLDNFDIKSAEKVMRVVELFGPFLDYTDGFIDIADEETIGTALAGQKVCVSGFRDANLAAKVERLGGTIQGNVSGKTTLLVTKDVNATSGKPKKARELGIKIMSVEEFKKIIGE